MSRTQLFPRSIFTVCSGVCLTALALAQTPVKPTQVSSTNAQTLNASAKTIPTLPPTLTIQPVGRSVRAIVITPDGKHVITGDLDGTVRMLELATNKVVRSFTGHSGEVTSVAISGDGAFVASGGIDKTARVFDSKTGTQISMHTHAQAVRGVALKNNADKKLQVWSASGKEVVHWMPEPQAPKVMHTISAHQGNITSLAMDPMAKVGITGSDDGYVFTWEPETGKIGPALNTSAKKVSITSLSIDPVTLKAIGADAAGNVVYFDAATMKEVSRFTGLAGQPVVAVAISKDGKRAIAAGKNKAFSFEPMTGLSSAEFKQGPASNYCGTVDPIMPTRALIAGDMDNTDPAHVGSVRMFDMAGR